WGEAREVSGADRGRGGVKQCTMISEGVVVKVVMGVVGIEGSPPAIPALHADDPFGCTVNCRAISCGIEAIKSERHGCRVVEIGIVRVFILESPATGPHPGTRHCPITGKVQDMLA